MPPQIRDHSPVGHAAYLDLRRLHLDDAVSDLRGTPTRKTVKGRVFWYDRFRSGTSWVERYIGEDGPELRARLDGIEALKAARAARADEKRRLVRILRAEGYASLDSKTGSILNAFARAGVFRLGGTLVGTVAFRLYEAELGVALGFDEMAMTNDIDIGSFERLSFAIGDAVEEDLNAVLAEFSFDPVPGLDLASVWQWRDAGRETLVEFLMPAQRDETVRPLPALGISARALRHLDFLLADPIKAVALYRTGVLVQIPRPEAFAIHKLIVADRRRGGPEALKSQKDRAQAAFLVEVLARDRPEELADAYQSALARGPKWQARIAASLARLPDTAARLAEVA
ncbi:MAG: hypothetical protein HKN02_10430 [Rhodobacteraceae bacterium]|nr:hypothetical protein [Paracoccaceae bacterium]